MDFHVEEREDHEEEEEEEEEEEGDDVNAAPTTYENSLSNPARLAEQATAAAAAGDWGRGGGQLERMIRYKECRKNHAVGIGKHAVDGCGEFLPSGPEGTVEALVCAACSCHRNFHRKENAATPAPITTSYPLALMAPPPPNQYQLPQATPSWYHHQVRVGPSPTRPLALPPAGVDDDDNNNNNSNHIHIHNNDNGGGGSGRKRHRTKFTQEQKERMLELAEKLGWRIQKHDEAEVERFCSETGVRRQVLKVWMHNNKLTLGKKP